MSARARDLFFARQCSRRASARRPLSSPDRPTVSPRFPAVRVDVLLDARRPL